MAQRILDIQSFSGGEADTLYKGPDFSYYQGENIEIRKDLSGMKLAPLLTDTGWVFDDDILCMVDLQTLGISNGGIVVCLENGKIYLNGTLKTTLNTGTTAHNRIDGIGVNTISDVQYVYYVTKTSSGTGKIHRSTSTLSSFDVSYKSYTVASGNTGFVGTINNVGNLYIAVANKVFKLDNTEVLTEDLVLPTYEDIAGFTQFQNNFKIYANQASTGVQYIRDGFSEAPDYRTEWINQPILSVVNDGAYDYAILGYSESYSDLYLISGTQKQELRVNLEGSTRKLGRPGATMSIREQIIYFPGTFTNYGVYTYGNYYPGTPKSLVQSYGYTSTLLFSTHTESSSYFAFGDNKVFYISHNETGMTFSTSGYVSSLVYQGGVWEELELDKFKVAFETNGGDIKIYARKAFGTGDLYTLIKTISNSSYGSTKKCYVSSNELIQAGINLNNFQEIQFKFELVRGATTTNNPKLKRFTAWFNINNNS